MPAPKKYPDEVRERAVRMVFEIREESGQQQGAIARVADRLGINRETLRTWIKQAELDEGSRTDGLKTEEREELSRLRRDNARLKEEREILSKAAAWFAQETEKKSKRSSSL